MSRQLGATVYLSLTALLIATAAPTTAAEKETNVLELMPDSAWAVAVVPNIGKVEQKLDRLMKVLKVKAENPLRKMLKGAKFGGFLDRDRAAGMAAIRVGSDVESEMKMVAFLPVTDYEKLTQALKAEKVTGGITRFKWELNAADSLMGYRRGYAIVTDEEGGDLLKEIVVSKKSVRPALAPIEKWLMRQDIAVAATPRGIHETMALGIKSMEETKKIFAELDPEQGAAAMKMFDLFIDAMRFLQREIKQSAAGLRYDDAGHLRLAGRADFAKDGWFAALGKETKPLEGGPLLALPRQKYAIAGGGPMPKRMVDGITDFYKKMLELSEQLNKLVEEDDPEGISQKQMQKMAEASLATLRGVEGTAVAIGGNAKGGVYDNMAAVVRATNARRYINDYGKLMRAVGMAEGVGPNKVKIEFDVTPLTIDGAKGLKIEMDMAKMFANLPGGGEEAAEMIKKMFGDKMRFWLVAADAKTVAMSYGKEETIRRTLKAVKEGQAKLRDDPQIKATEKLLPAGAQWAVYVHPKGMADYIRGIVKHFDAGAAAMIPDIPDTPPVGMAARISPQSLDVEIVVPAKVLEAAGEIVKQIGIFGLEDAQPDEAEPKDLDK